MMEVFNCWKMNSLILFASVLIITDINSVIGDSETTVEDPIRSLKRYFEENKKAQVSTSTPNNNGKSVSPDLDARFYMGVFANKFGPRDQYMAHCESLEDCDAGIRMICKDFRCTCRPGELFFEWPKFGCFVKAHMFEKCEVSGQCMAMNPNTYCNPENGRCTCSPNYFFNGQECSLRYDSANLKAQEVYKAAVVAAACFIVAVVGIFVACIVRRSFCRREQIQQSESNRNSDIFSISDEIAALRAVDKPPSYEEVLQIERTFYGIPPPEYSEPRSTNSATSQLPVVSSSVVPDSVNLSLSPGYESSAVATGSRSSCANEGIKESTANSTNFDENSINNSQLQTSDISDFITAAEVLPVPSDVENMSPLLSGAPSHSAHTLHLSSTPPPPRLHRNYVKSEQGSSSLPSSPYLSTISSRVKNTVIDLHAISRKELLKQDSITTQPEASHLSQDSCSSLSEASDLSMPLELGTNNTLAEFDHSMTVIAYDNLGFESDLYL